MSLTKDDINKFFDDIPDHVVRGLSSSEQVQLHGIILLAKKLDEMNKKLDKLLGKRKIIKPDF